MSNLKHMQDVLESCPKLYYEYRTEVPQYSEAGMTNCRIEEMYTVDYAQKTASVITAVSQNGVTSTVTTIYRNRQVFHYYHGMTPDDQMELSETDYDTLFAVDGPLRPVNFKQLSPDGRTLMRNGSEASSLQASYHVLSKDCLKIQIHGTADQTTMNIHILS